MARRSPLLILLLALGALALTSRTAFAAAPANDTFGGATAVSALPFHNAVDTREAATDSDDTAVSAACGAGGGSTSSVWYAFTPSKTGRYLISTSGSSYTTGIGVVSGNPSGFASAGCFLNSGTPDLQAGTTYYIDIADFYGQGGGDLSLTVQEDTPPEVHLTVDDVGRFDARTGKGTVTGTITCTASAFGDVSDFVAQAVGRVSTITANGFWGDTCTGSPVKWTTELTPASGKFAGGKATVDAEAWVFAANGSASDVLKKTITLKH